MLIKEIEELIKQKQYDQAIELINTLSVEEQLAGKVLHAKIFLLTQKYYKALNMVKKTLEESHLKRDKTVELGFLVIRGLAYYYMNKRNDLSQIVIAGEKLISQMRAEEKSKVKEWEANLLNIKGSLLYHEKKYDSAIETFRKNYKLHKELDNKKEMYFALDNICLCNFDKGDFQSALKCQLKILPIIREIDTKKNIAIFLNDIGSTYIEIGDLDIAIKYYEESLEIFKEIGEYKSIILALDKIINLYRKQGDEQLISEYNAQLIKLKEKINPKSRWIIDDDNH